MNFKIMDAKIDETLIAMFLYIERKKGRIYTNLALKCSIKVTLFFNLKTLRL
jgi:hypothetical protein